MRFEPTGIIEGADLDRNQIKDYWTGDVATLMDLWPDRFPRIAGADTAPLNALGSKPVPYHGYYFVVLDRDNSTVPSEDYRQDTDKSGRKVHNLSRYGICAYPAEYTWQHQRTFIFDADTGMYSVDNGEQPVFEWPSKAELSEKFIKLEWKSILFPG